ncbi:MAG TPA: peptidase MA family metallohydrolase [bacterium]|nr:peptidase MA family metallohydrolase [bacterium]HPR86547.1 peptidase MA family metallohydrolase [bacterium]
MRTVLVFVLLLYFAPGAAETPAFNRRCADRICTYAGAEDGRFADESLRVLQQAREEIQHDLGITHQDTLRVIIAPSRAIFREYFQGHLPEWTQAFAIPAAATMIVRSPRWDRPEASFRQSLVHELLHLLLHQRIGTRELPRWLDEGMAIFYAEHAEYENKSALSRALATGSLIPLEEIDSVLEFDQNRAQLAYQESYSAVRYLLATYDSEALRTLLSGIAAGEDLDALFLRATGSTQAEFEREWRGYLERTQKWLWLSEVDELIWVALPLLFLLVFLIIRYRNRRRLAEWEGALEGGVEGSAEAEETAGAAGVPWMAPHLMPRRHPMEPEEGLDSATPEADTDQGAAPAEEVEPEAEAKPGQGAAPAEEADPGREADPEEENGIIS